MSTELSGDTAIFKTIDGGANWTAFQNAYGGTSGMYGSANFEMHPLYPDTIYSNTCFVAKSTDECSSWQTVHQGWGAMCFQPEIMKICYEHPNLIFAWGETAIFSPYLIKSSDHGQSWKYTTLPYNGDNACYCLIINPNDTSDLMVGMEGKILHSIDGGNNWTNVFNPITYSYIYDMDISPNNDNLIYAAGSDNGTAHGDLLFYRTYDYGSNWDTVIYPASSGLYRTNDMEILSTTHVDNIYLATNRGVFKYSNDQLVRNENQTDVFYNVSLFPNPCDNFANLKISLKKDSEIRIYINDLTGRRIVEIYEGKLQKGSYQFKIDINTLSKGIYFYNIECVDNTVSNNSGKIIKN